MAEFKLGRIRFVWKNTWASSTTYYKDDVVRYGGKTYMCISGHTSSAATNGFYTDLSSSYWQLAADGQAWTGTWSSGTSSYKIGDLVKYGGTIYICITGHVPQSTLEADQSKWDTWATSFNFIGAWVAATVYKVGDIVTYGASVYRCNTGHTAAATNALGLEANQSSWDTLNQSFAYIGTWSASSVRYKVNDVVKYGAGLWICTTYHTSTASGFATTNFSRLVDGLEFSNSWSNSTAFAVGDVVTYGGYTYVAKQNITTASLSVTSGSGTGTTSTLNFASQSIVPFVIGQSVTVTGVTGNLAVTSASGAGGIATLIFASQSVPPFQNNQTITVSGVSNSGYNGTYTVLSCSTTQVTYSNATTAAATGGNIAVQGYNGSFVITGVNATSVSYANTNIVATTGGTITNSPPTTNTGSWGLLSTGFSLLGAWTTATAYKIGQVVTYGAYSYLVTADHSSSATNLPTNTSYYTLLNPGMRWTTYSTAASYVSPTNTTTSGTGSGATFTVGVNGTVYTVTKTGNGTGYSTGAVIKIAGTQVGGITPANDILITVQQTGGAVSTFTFTGVAATWYSGSAYILGDQVTIGYNSYICILAHTAATGNRPDNDTTGTYWNQVASGAETNVLTTQGDIVYFGGAGATRLPIGTDGQVLKIVGTTPTWATFGQIANVYYVAPSGTDNYSSGYGITLDKPFATIKYACSIVAAGTNNPNASALLTKNKTWMQNEMWYWSTYQKSISANGFTPSSVYDQTKSYRDSAYIIDGVIYDITRGGNSQTVFNAFSYFQPGTNTFINSTVAAEMPYFIAMLTQLASLMQNALTQVAPGTSYQTLMTATDPVSQVLSGSASESGVTTTVSTLMGYITTALTNTSTAALPARNNGLPASIFVKTGTYNEQLPISVPENCSIIGDELRTTIVQPAATTATVTGFISNGTNLASGNTLSITSVSAGSPAAGFWVSGTPIALPTQISSVNSGTVNSATMAGASLSSTGSITSIVGASSPFTATVVGLTSTGGFTVGSAITATNGTNTALSGMASSGAGVFTCTAPSFTLAAGMVVVLVGTNTGTATNVAAGTYTISSVASQTQFTITALATATSGTIVTQTWTVNAGAISGGSPTSLIVTSILNATSLTYTQVGGTSPVAGPVTAVSTSQLTAGASSTGLTLGGVLSGGSVTAGTFITSQSYGASGTAVVNTVSSGTISTNTITVTANTSIAIGQLVSGNGALVSGLPADTYVTHITGTTVTLSKNLIGTISSTALYFFAPGGAGVYALNQPASGTPTTSTSYTVTLAQQTSSATLSLNYTTGNMFYLRNGAILRNMTFQGLSGTLGTANSYGTQRPTAGAYASLDPGAGPGDTTVWIFARSPYVQNVTTFGTACIGLKVDGALHNGGNQSIVANDFTHVLSDGIGAWVTNLGRTELVSVFTYYNNIGYLSENGGKIRATNGNNSYGLYGSVAEGVNTNETPLTGTVNNRAGTAATGLIVNNAAGALLRVEYSNAGSNYSTNFMISGQATGYTFNGGNNDAVALGDETRDGAIFETRVISSGLGYTYISNTPQAGDAVSITLAATDNSLSAAYLGLRVIVNGGTGAGQYGYIANYNAGSKIALVAKESFAPITVSATSAVGNILTVPSTITLYAGLPVVFTGTAYTGSLLSTLTTYYVVAGTITNTTFQLATSSALALAGSANAITLGTTSGSTFILNAAGWDHMIPGTAIAATLDTTSTYQVESKITLSAPTFSYTPGTISSAAWASQTYGNGYYVAVAGTATGTTTAGYSTNGTTWTVGSSLPASVNWSGVAAGVLSGTWYYMAVSTGSASAAYSTNGSSWSSATGLVVGNWNCIAYGNSGTTGYFMTVNNGNNGCYISTTGSTWTVTGNLPTSATWSCLAYGTGPKIWITLAGGAVSSNVFAYSTSNGTSWLSGTLPVSANWTSITWGNNRFVAVAQGSTAVIYSTNGTTWTQSPTGLITSYAWNNIKYGQGTFLATATTLSPTVTNTSAGNNLITLSSTTGIATGQSLIPTAVTQATTATATTSATAVTNNNAIISGTVFTPGQVNTGTFATGMTLSGSGVYAANSIAITAVSGNGTNVVYTFATQSIVPFQVNQSITIQGVLPTGFNGTFAVTGATINTVTVANTTNAATTALGTITSTPTYITAQTNFTSTSSTIIGTTLTVGGTITGTVAVGQYLSGVTWSNNFAQIIGTTLSLAGTTTGTVAANQYVAGYQLTNTNATSTYVTSGTQISSIVNPTFTGQVSAGTAITFTGYTIGNVLYVTSTPSSTGIVVGMTLAGTGITGGTYIVSNINGSATTTGQWVINLSQTLASSGSPIALTATPVTINCTGVTGSILPGTVISGSTSMPTAQNLTITSISGNGITVNVYYATQGAAPFIAGQSITIAGSTGTGSVYNGVWTVTGATTSLVQFSSALTASWVSGGVITNAGAFICANGTGSGGAGTYYVACSAQLSTASLSLIGTYYVVNNSQTVLQTSTINGNQTIGYITLFGSGTGGAGTYTVSSSLAIASAQAINGVNYTVNQSQTVSATQITGISNTATVGTTTGMVVGETVALTGGSAAVTPTLTATTTGTNALTLNSGTGVTAGLAIVPTAVTYSPTITNTSPLSNYVTFSGTGASSITQGMSFVHNFAQSGIASATASATVNATTSLTSSTINAAGVLTTGGGSPQVGMVLTGTGMQVAQNIQITAASGSGTTATLTYATQGSVPFLTGQLITVQGMIPAAYNGTFVVTGTPTTTQVTYASNATGSMTTAGNVISLPTYIVSGSATTWQVNWTTGAAQASLTTFTGTANLITLNSVNNLVIGSQFTTPGTGTFGNLVPNTAYYITAIVPSTSQISVSTQYQGTTNVTLTSAAASWSTYIGNNLGGLNAGQVYYVASVTNNSGNSSTAGTQYYATLSTSPTLSPVTTLGWGAGNYTTAQIGGVLGGTMPTVVSTASGGNLLQLSNTNNIVLGQIITPAAVSQSLSVTSTVNATASLTTSTISTAGVLTVGAGTPIPGMILTGTGVQVVQNITTTAITGNGTTTTVTYATQGSVPFLTGQLITIQGAVPASYNGTYTVTGTPTTTQVQFANTTLLTATTQGIVLSQPTYVVSQLTATTWQTNLLQSVAVASTTITGTANLIGVSITGSTASIANITTGQTFVTPGSGTFGNLVASTTYYVKAVSPLTNQISVSTTYFGGDFAVTGTAASPTTGSYTATSAATYGSLTAGTPYYVSSIPAPGYVTLATNSTLSTPVTLSMGNGQWTIASNGVVGGVNSGQVYYVVSGGASTTISPSPTLSPVLQLTSGAANWTTSVSSTFGGLAYSAGSVANYYVTEIISSTQLALGTSYFGPNAALVTATGGSVTVTAGSNFGGLTSGTTYYVASITGNQVALSTSATLSPTITVTNGNGAWTSVIGTTSTAAASSNDGINWTVRSVPSNSWSGVVFGNPGNVPKWSMVATNSATSASIPNFTPAQARLSVSTNAIGTIRIVEPGSGYLSVPTITITDPNITSAATLTPRIGVGALANPSFVNRGTGFATANASISSSVGYADSYQVGQYFNVNNLPGLPTAGSNVVLSNNAIYYKLVLYSSAVGTQATFTGYISGTTLYVTSNVGQTITTGMYLQAFGITTPVNITANLTGSGLSSTSTWTIGNSTNGNIGSSTVPVSIVGGTYSATYQINPTFTTTNAPAHGDVVTTRILYSQVRLTGHDFLSIGTGNIVTTNYPNTPTQPANANNQTVQNGGGRVFFTSTDQDGNFNVGNLFSVQQSTGVATLNANAFNLAGLQTLTLGSVALGTSNTVITQFSTDGTFAANSDSIIPTQKAIRTYITSQIGGGASSINVNTLIAGQIQITGNTISNTNQTQINVRNKMYFKQGIDGSPLALNYFLLK